MKIKIYFGPKPLFLADQIDAELSEFTHHEDTVLIDELSPPGINSMLHEMRQQKIHAGIYLHPDLEQLRKAVWKKFILVPAAGGLVINELDQILLIHRRGKWDLPKGKLDEGEDLETCAVREVEEETGVKASIVGGPLLTTYHCYDENGKHLLKESHWYRMSAGSSRPPVPQTNEDITEAVWAEKNTLESYVSFTFPSILDVWKAAGLL